ncbi:MAG: enoyl-CoA hydratase/isomerase family protein [Bacteriovoracaceae bacterium]|nr:enoyl-CoA hydratase/isomerase family protein [Bacteriovoracaceae bacterium]
MNIDLKNILFEVGDKGIAQITINRADKLNALNADVLSELRSVLGELSSNDDYIVKGLILTGSGEKAFIAGADIKQMQGLDDSGAYEFSKLGQEVSVMLEELNIPVIAAVNGFALGGGCEMAMACDFIYATENALFGQPEVKLGLIPGFGGTQRLARAVGRATARELIYTGRNVGAAEAKELGLVSRVFPSKEALLEAANKTFSEILKNSPLAVGCSKKVINGAVDLPLKEALNYELEEFSIIFKSEDMREGTTAFLEKRKAEFTGK